MSKKFFSCIILIISIFTYANANPKYYYNPYTGAEGEAEIEYIRTTSEFSISKLYQNMYDEWANNKKTKVFERIKKLTTTDEFLIYQALSQYNWNKGEIYVIILDDYHYDYLRFFYICIKGDYSLYDEYYDWEGFDFETK